MCAILSRGWARGWRLNFTCVFPVPSQATVSCKSSPAPTHDDSVEEMAVMFVLPSPLSGFIVSLASMPFAGVHFVLLLMGIPWFI